MDIELEKRMQETMDYIRQLSDKSFEESLTDPVVRMMLAALLNESQKMNDYIDNLGKKISERFCNDFIPGRQISAIPSVVLLNPSFRQGRNTEMEELNDNSLFVYKSKEQKLSLNYIPILKTMLLPYSNIVILPCSQTNQIWIGIETTAEVECMDSVSMLIKGTGGISPISLHVGSHKQLLDCSTMKQIENMEMMKPFDAQQSSGQLFEMVETWKDQLISMDDMTLTYITDKTMDRDLFKPRVEDSVSDICGEKRIWFLLDFPEDYDIPDNIEVVFNVFPVVNVDVCNVTLTQANPIAKLQKIDGSFFLNILETDNTSRKQGFSKKDDEIIVRDFDASIYNNGDLYRDVRNLYNRFMDDYYAFIEYNGIKDGEVLKLLRETINKMGKSVGEENSKYKFDSGTYVMRNMNNTDIGSSTIVKFTTTFGRLGNSPQAGETMENKKNPALTQKVTIMAGGMGGEDKISVDARYELLRYYALTNDRLYSKMDIEAFMRKEIIAEFGKEEFPRILINSTIEGAGGTKGLCRGLYIDISFKDEKNYLAAQNNAFDKRMEQKIRNKSCISMPIHVSLIDISEG